MKPYAPDTFDRLLRDLHPRPAVTGKDVEEIVQVLLTGCLLWLCVWCMLVNWVDGPYVALPYFN